MKGLIFFVIVILTYTSSNAQPCKVVKIGMSKSEVLKLAGRPSEIDTLPIGKSANSLGIVTDSLRVVWQYGDPFAPGNQRVLFYGDVVEDDVVADGKKYDELLMTFKQGEFNTVELMKRIKKINQDACK